MKSYDIQAAVGTAFLLLSLPCEAKHNHASWHLDRLGKRHTHRNLHLSPRVESAAENGLAKRATCQFPTDAGLVAVTPHAKNAGWAMSPDQECVPNSYCPIACPPGQVMAQWNPKAKVYPGPNSMDGGLFCDGNGKIQKPIPENPYCVEGTGSLTAQNNCGKVVSFCQTVLPGNEAMIIPTRVDGKAPLAVPGPSYWLGTSAHYYVNPPGVDESAACVWGDISQGVGNWSPYVAGGNTDANGNTFAKIAWNPEWLNSPHSGKKPAYGVKIECSSGDCNGLPCSIDPAEDGIGGVTSKNEARGTSGASFCVVTIPKGASAKFVVFNSGDSDSEYVEPQSSAVESSTETEPEPTPEPVTSSSSSASPSTSASSSVNAKPTGVFFEQQGNSTSAKKPAYSPHILFESTNNTNEAISSSAEKTSTPTAAAASTSTEKSEANSVSGSIFSLLVVFVAAAYIL